MNVEIAIIGTENLTGNVTLKYTLIFKNISGETLERVILKDFELQVEVEMDKTYFEALNLLPETERHAAFVVTAKGGGLNPLGGNGRFHSKREYRKAENMLSNYRLMKYIFILSVLKHTQY